MPAGRYRVRGLPHLELHLAARQGGQAEQQAGISGRCWLALWGLRSPASRHGPWLASALGRGRPVCQPARAPVLAALELLGESGHGGGPPCRVCWPGLPKAGCGRMQALPDCSLDLELQQAQQQLGPACSSLRSAGEASMLRWGRWLASICVAAVSVAAWLMLRQRPPHGHCTKVGHADWAQITQCSLKPAARTAEPCPASPLQLGLHRQQRPRGPAQGVGVLLRDPVPLQTPYRWATPVPGSVPLDQVKHREDATYAFLLARHGTRWPTRKRLKQIATLGDELQLVSPARGRLAPAARRRLDPCQH